MLPWQKANPPPCRHAQCALPAESILPSASRGAAGAPRANVMGLISSAGGGIITEDMFSPKSSYRAEVLPPIITTREKYLHPRCSSGSSRVHCLDVARSSSSNHKPPAHRIPHNLQAEQKGFKNQGMGWIEDMQQFLVRWRALLTIRICHGGERENRLCPKRGAEPQINCSLQSCFLINIPCQQVQKSEAQAA